MSTEKDVVLVAAELTKALIIAGHVPPALHNKADSSADHAVDLFDSVLKKLNESYLPG